MTGVRVAHTADLDAQTLHAARGLLYDVFEDEMTEDDWEHCLGGIHALVVEDGEIVAHGAVVQRRLLHAGRALRTGYLEGIAVRADRRRRGHATAVMDELERFVRGAYDLGALGTTDEAIPFYESRGWLRWHGHLSALTPNGVVRTPEEEGWIYVLPSSVRLDLSGELTCGWREGDVW